MSDVTKHTPDTPAKSINDVINNLKVLIYNAALLLVKRLLFVCEVKLSMQLHF